MITEKESSKKLLKHSVPQGYKLGPILVNSYIAPLSNTAVKHGISDKKYADDEQLILSFKTETLLTQKSSFTKMEKCIEDIRKFWLDKLCNNSEKTEFILTSSPQQLSKMEIKSIQVKHATIKSTDKVQNLGVISTSQ